MTWSIVARDPLTGQFGVAVATRFFAVGSLVPHVRGERCAVATQAFVSPLWGMEAADRLAEGELPAAVVLDLVHRDAGESQRQIHMIDARGNIAAHTGAKCIDWCGQVQAEGVSVAGNMLANGRVIADTLACYLNHPDLPFAERLMTAMEAGEAAGGDKRGKQAAALRIQGLECYARLDLRVDEVDVGVAAGRVDLVVHAEALAAVLEPRGKVLPERRDEQPREPEAERDTDDQSDPAEDQAHPEL